MGQILYTPRYFFGFLGDTVRNSWFQGSVKCKSRGGKSQKDMNKQHNTGLSKPTLSLLDLRYTDEVKLTFTFMFSKEQYK